MGKYVALAFILSMSVIAVWKYRKKYLVSLLFLSLVALSPYLNFWTVAGLETPYLAFLAFLITLLFIEFVRDPGAGRAMLIPLLSGILFVMRYDTAVFTAPIVLFVLLHSERATAIKAVFASALIPVSWLAFSYGYYGDVFPTSFHYKTPTFNILKIGQNLRYIIEYALFSFLFITILMFSLGGQDLRAEIGDHLKRYRFLWASDQCEISLAGLGAERRI